MKTILIALALALVVMTGQAQASSATFCDGWSSTAEAMLSVRQQGLDKEGAQAILEEAGVWSGTISIALDKAFSVPVDTDPTAFKARMFKACREDDV